MTYEIPLDGFDRRVSLQTLARRVSRACVHYLQVRLLTLVGGVFPLTSFAGQCHSCPVASRPAPPPGGGCVWLVAPDLVDTLKVRLSAIRLFRLPSLCSSTSLDFWKEQERRGGNGCCAERPVYVFVFHRRSFLVVYGFPF